MYKLLMYKYNTINNKNMHMKFDVQKLVSFRQNNVNFGGKNLVN